MQDTKSLSNKQDFPSKTNVVSFLDNFKAYSFLRNANIDKIRSVSIKDILIPMITLPFRKKNFYQGIVMESMLCFKKSVAYNFLNKHSYN